MLKNGLLTLLFAFIPGAGQMYQGYMKRGLSLVLMCCTIGAVAMLFSPIAFFLLVVFMYSFFDTLNLRAQIALGNAPEDDYLVHFDPKDKRLARMLLDSHKLVGWVLIAFGVLIVYQNVVMEALNEVLWRWGRDSVVFRAFYLVMERLPDVAVCVALIVCGIWLVRGPRKKATPSPEDDAESEDAADFREYHAEAEDAPVLTLPENHEPDEPDEENIN